MRLKQENLIGAINFRGSLNKLPLFMYRLYINVKYIDFKVYIGYTVY